jgi:signal peptidase I
LSGISAFFSSPVMFYLERIAGIAGLFVIAYIIISSVVSLFRPSSPPAPNPTVLQGVSGNAGVAAPGFEDGFSTQAEHVKEKPSKGKSTILEIVETIVMTVLIFAAVRLMVQNFRIEGNSMEPNLHHGQYLIIEKMTYRFSEPKRGDVVVFHYPSNPNRDFIKRIIGVPGDTVQIQRGQVLINGTSVQEPYGPYPASYRWGPGVVGEDQYFVLGDNRNNSSDSHSWGMLPEELIVGRAWFSYWPVTEIGIVPHYDFPEAVSLLESGEAENALPSGKSPVLALPVYEAPEGDFRARHIGQISDSAFPPSPPVKAAAAAKG